MCSAAAGRFEGHIAKYLGDGLLVYFGYPQAHEDDPQRAVRAGLAILENMGELNALLRDDNQLELAVRIGVHTGLVVAGEMGGGETLDPWPSSVRRLTWRPATRGRRAQLDGDQRRLPSLAPRVFPVRILWGSWPERYLCAHGSLPGPGRDRRPN